VRAVLDPNVLISSVLAPHGAPGRLLRAWRVGAFDLIVSPALLDELARALGYPKLRDRVPPAEAREFVELLRRRAELREDPTTPAPVASADPDDDYLIALAAASQAVIVSGDRHLLDLADELPIYSPAAFAAIIEGDEQ
jgi:uncharacterized protein